MTTVEFKSTPENYKKEKSGLKPNTLRKIDQNDDRFITLRDKGKIDYKFIDIKIINTRTGKSFEREITDYTEYDGYAIISWKHIDSIKDFGTIRIYDKKKCTCDKCMGL